MTSAPRFSLLAAGAVAAAALAGCSAKGGSNPDLVAGKKLFVQKCGSCHTLSHAGTKGTTGPNLDDAFANPVHEGFGASAIKGMVRQQIAIARKGGVMPQGLVKGDQAQDVASYVAQVVSQPGKDSGLLASAVPSASSSKPAVESADGTLTIPADPNGQLAYANSTATGKAGKITIDMPNMSGTPHNISIDGKGAGKIVPKGVSTFSATFAAGTYTYYCQVPGHKQAGMLGKLTVK
ncbi:MAG: c-type cytochrome [Solirubrobacterales bacterium]|nr:c-type cytochrome [Solirubrobacterales bacterium]